MWRGLPNSCYSTCHHYLFKPLPLTSISDTPQRRSGPILRDTARPSQRYPPIACYRVFSVSTWPIGCDTPPPPVLSLSHLESMRSGGAIPPPPHKRCISAMLARYPMKTRQMGAIHPSAILSRKGIARYGGVSRTGPLSPKVWCTFLSEVGKQLQCRLCM